MPPVALDKGGLPSKVGPITIQTVLGASDGFALAQGIDARDQSRLVQVVFLEKTDGLESEAQRRQEEKRIARATTALLSLGRVVVHAHGGLDVVGGARLLYWVLPHVELLAWPAAPGPMEVVGLARALAAHLAELHAKGRTDPLLHRALVARTKSQEPFVAGVEVFVTPSLIRGGANELDCTATELEQQAAEPAGDVLRLGRVLERLMPEKPPSPDFAVFVKSLTRDEEHKRPRSGAEVLAALDGLLAADPTLMGMSAEPLAPFESEQITSTAPALSPGGLDSLRSVASWTPSVSEGERQRRLQEDRRITDEARPRALAAKETGGVGFGGESTEEEAKSIGSASELSGSSVLAGPTEQASALDATTPVAEPAVSTPAFEAKADVESGSEAVAEVHSEPVTEAGAKSDADSEAKSDADSDKPRSTLDGSAKSGPDSDSTPAGVAEDKSTSDSNLVIQARDNADSTSKSEVDAPTESDRSSPIGNDSNADESTSKSDEDTTDSGAASADESVPSESTTNSEVASADASATLKSTAEESTSEATADSAVESEATSADRSTSKSTAEESASAADSTSKSASDSEAASAADSTSKSASDSDAAPAAHSTSESASDSDAALAAASTSKSASDSDAALGAEASSKSASDSEAALAADSTSKSASDSDAAPAADSSSKSASDSDAALAGEAIKSTSDSEASDQKSTTESSSSSWPPAGTGDPVEQGAEQAASSVAEAATDSETDAGDALEPTPSLLSDRTVAEVLQANREAQELPTQVDDSAWPSGDAESLPEVSATEVESLSDDELDAVDPASIEVPPLAEDSNPPAAVGGRADESMLESWASSEVSTGESPWSEVEPHSATPVEQSNSLEDIEEAKKKASQSKSEMSDSSLAALKHFDPKKAIFAGLVVVAGLSAMIFVSRSQEPPPAPSFAAMVPADHEFIVESQPPGATIIAEADGRTLGATPLTFMAPAGMRPKVFVWADGHEPAAVEIAERGGVSVRLSPIGTKTCRIKLEGAGEAEAVVGTLNDGVLEVAGVGLLRARGDAPIQGARLVRCPRRGGAEQQELQFGRRVAARDFRVTEPAGASGLLFGEPLGRIPSSGRTAAAFAEIRVDDEHGMNVTRWVPIIGGLDVRMPSPPARKPAVVELTDPGPDVVDVEEDPPPPAGRRIRRRDAAKKSLKSGNRALIRGRLKTARRAFAECLRLDPKQADCHKGLGTLYKRLKQRSKSNDNYRRYLELKPDAADAPRIRRLIRD